MPAAKSKAVAKRGPGSDEDFVFDSSVGEIVVQSLAKAPKPNAWEMLELEIETNERIRNAKANMMMIKLASGDAFDLVKQLDVEEMGEFITAWGEHSGVGLGESRAS